MVHDAYKRPHVQRVYPLKDVAPGLGHSYLLHDVTPDIKVLLCFCVYISVPLNGRGFSGRF